MTRQLAFDLPVRSARGRGDYFAAPSNAAALAAVEGWRDWPDGRLVLVGDAGAGKSHLTQVWLAQCPGARSIPAADLSADGVPALARAPLAVEQADAVAGDPPAERALLHLVNLMGVERQPLLLTARMAPGVWPAVLPDLASRLQAMSLARIEPPCDPLLAAVLVKLFADRQLAVSPALVGWLVQRIERSLAAAADVVASLDAAALAEGRALTLPFALRVLDRSGADGQDGAPVLPERR